MNDYHNPYVGAEVMHGILRYPGSVRPIPGLDEELVAENREKVKALSRAMKRKGSGQFQPPGLETPRTKARLRGESVRKPVTPIE